jgi:hypothetical protein
MGTVRLNRKNRPKELEKKENSYIKDMLLPCSHKMIAVKWHDKEDLLLF